MSDDPVPVDDGEIARISWLVFGTSSCRRYENGIPSYLHFARSSLGSVVGTSLRSAHGWREWREEKQESKEWGIWKAGRRVRSSL